MKNTENKGSRDQKMMKHLRVQIAYYTDQMSAILAKVRAGEFGEVPQFSKVVQDLIAANSTLISIENRIAEEIKKFEKSRTEFDINLDAIRDRIRSRLAKLTKFKNSK